MKNYHSGISLLLLNTLMGAFLYLPIPCNHKQIVTVAEMAELLTALLASPSSIPDLLSTSPPCGISHEVWALRFAKAGYAGPVYIQQQITFVKKTHFILWSKFLNRHELPLHLINFLRDQADPLLIASAVPSPTKSSSGRYPSESGLRIS